MSENLDKQRDEYDKRYVRTHEMMIIVFVVILAAFIQDACHGSQLRDLQRRVGAIESREKGINQ